MAGLSFVVQRRHQPTPARADPVRRHRSVNSQRAYHLHALDAIDAVLDYTEDGRDAFFADRKTQDAVIRNIEVLGQAIKGVNGETRTHGWRPICRGNSSGVASAVCDYILL